MGWIQSLNSLKGSKPLWEQLPAFQSFCLQGNMVEELSEPREQPVFISQYMCATHGRCTSLLVLDFRL